MAQILNGLCGIGVKLVLDRLSGRLGAIAGAVAVGLLFHQPAFYVNWGRFTQLASQSIMLAAWLVTFDTLRHWVRADAGRTRATLFRQGLAAALLTAAVFLLHFRVFAFYVALLAPSLVMVIGRDWSAARWRRLVTGSLYIGGVALVFVSSALWDALAQYRASITLAAPRQLVSTEEQRVGAQRYYEFPLEAYYGLGIHRHMAWASLVAAALGLLRRNGLVVLATVWTALLLGLGYAYLLPVRWLAITNLGAVIIMLYLPASLAIGVAVEELYRLVCRRFAWAARPSLWAAAMVAAGLVVAPYRARDLETYRYFVTESDVRAMDWIRANTAPDALFAVNTYFWLPTMAHGMDAGYWIPYFTGRRMTAGVMLVDQADVAYQARILELSRLVEQAKSDPLAVAGLQEQGVDYIYLGPIGNIYTGPLDAQVLRSSPLVETVYDEDGVVILRIKAVHP
ncbi:MAG: hypothetical protein H3C34_24260 [Caldilineaceae bacterium]|nr:hypothetical protein [Caldilineaceae bacterium]